MAKQNGIKRRKRLQAEIEKSRKQRREYNPVKHFGVDSGYRFPTLDEAKREKEVAVWQRKHAVPVRSQQTDHGSVRSHVYQGYFPL